MIIIIHFSYKVSIQDCGTLSCGRYEYFNKNNAKKQATEISIMRIKIITATADKCN